MSDVTGANAPVPAGEEMGPFARLAGVFVSPSKTFASIARKPGWDWLLPAVLLAAAAFVQQSVLVPRIDTNEVVRAQTRMVEKLSGHELSAQDRQKLEQQVQQGVEKSKSPVRRALSCLIIIGVLMIVPAIYHGIAAAFGAKTSYLRVLGGYAYTQAIQLVPMLLTVVVALPRDHLDMNDVQFQRVLKSNLGALLPWESTSKALLALLSSVDVFDIWAYVVGSIALSYTTRFSRKAAFAVVGSVWGAYILIKVALGAVYGNFAG